MRSLIYAAGLLSCSTPALATEGSLGGTAGSVAQMLLALGIVLALLIGTLHLLRRLSRGQGGGSGNLRIRGAAAVGPRERVVLVEVGGKVLVLGVAPGRVTPLHTLDVTDLPPAQPPAAIPGDFQRWLKETLERRTR